MGKRALVMSGGSARGAFEAGAADYLIRQRNLSFDVITGVSVGSLNGAKLAQAKGQAELEKEMAELHDLWLGITSAKDFYKKSILGPVVLAFRNHLYDLGPTAKTLKKQVDPDRLRKSGRELRVGAVSLETGAYHSVTQDEPDLHQWILASIATPVVFPPATIGGAHWVDGGLRDITPLSDALLALKDAGGGSNTDLDEIYVLLSSPLDLERVTEVKWDALHVALRSLDILTSEIYREDLLHMLDVNKSVTAYLRVEKELLAKGWSQKDIDRLLDGFQFKPGKYRPVRIWAVAPSEAYLDWFTMEIDHEKIVAAFNGGYAAAQKPMDEAELLKKLRP
ncbi:MAG: hypothetical protein EXR93_11300 [Gemmatimonadetes bacterium]|nr:hypothetical protein [Gemmatimonadota bacterium]